jgi:hypothetical protein
MKKQTLFLLLFFGFFIAFFSSCVNHDYDLNNEKIDKNIVLSPGGANFLVGNVEKFLVFEKIGYDDIRVAADGSLYIEYEGDFNPGQFQVPRYDIDFIAPVNTENISIEQLSPGVFDFSSHTGKVPLLEGETVEYEVTKPQFDNTEENQWTIDPDQIIFDSFTINLRFILEGFSNVSGNAKVNLYMTFPKDIFEVEGETLDDKGRITRSIDFNSASSVYVLPKGIKLKSYKYPVGLSKIIFDLDLGEISGFKGTVNNPLFKLTLATDNNNIAIQSIKGKVTGKASIKDEIDGFDALKSSFGEGAILHFENPSLFLLINTNLGADFRLDIDKVDAHNGQSVSLTGNNNGLMFTKPTDATSKTTSYYIAPNPPAGATGKQLDLDKLFTPIPEKISYIFSMNVNEPNATIVNNNLILQGNYKFTLPFSFKNLKVNVKIAPIYLGENIYDDFLQYMKSKITIKADTVIVSAEKFNQLELTATIKFMDAGQQVVDNSITKSVTLVNGLNKDKFAIDFSRQDLEKMEKAQYLEIEFMLGGKGVLTQNDYIDIRSLRFISDGGFHYDFE